MESFFIHFFETLFFCIMNAMPSSIWSYLVSADRDLILNRSESFCLSEEYFSWLHKLLLFSTRLGDTYKESQRFR